MVTIFSFLNVNNLCVIIIIQFLSTQCHQLSVSHSRVKLPFPKQTHRLWYDGKDDVYIFGGSLSSGDIQRVLKYSLTSDTIHLVGSLPSFRLERKHTYFILEQSIQKMTKC